MSREELIILVEKILVAAGATEEENNKMIDKFEENVPDPNATDYIFSPRYGNLSAEEIVEKALSYKSIKL